MGKAGGLTYIGPVTAASHIDGAEHRGRIPVVSLTELREGAGRAEAIRRLGEGLEATGFVALTDHGVAPKLLDAAYQCAETTFALPEASKRAYEVPATGRQRGYTSMGIEHAKDQAVSDLKELWQVGREAPEVLENVYPSEVETFRDDVQNLFAALDGVCGELLAAIGTYLGRPEGFFEQLTADGNSVLRLIHYPPLSPSAPEGAVRAAAHEDINLITILPVSTAPGLQLLGRDGKWLDVETPPDVMICDTGDMMAILTDGRLPATTHRVVNPVGPLARTSRYSMPFFCHPHPQAILRPERDGQPALTAKEALWERLREIGLT